MDFVFHDGGRAAAGYAGMTGDYVTRSIAIATRKTYQEAYDVLNHLAQAERRGRRKKKLSSSRTGVFRRTYQRYLESLGWRWTSTMSIGSGCRVHLRTSELPPGALIIKASRHLTAAIDGVLYEHPRLLASRSALRIWLLFKAVTRFRHPFYANFQNHSPTSILKGNSMKPSKLYEALHALIGERVPLHIWGACGVGKSQIVSQVANDLDYDFLDVRAVQLDPVDLRGLPRIVEGQTEWVPPKFLPTTGKGILFLDELTSAPQMTQAGCYQLVLDRKLGEYVLPEGWVVIAAGNPASERGVHFAMPRPLRNRFVHLDLEPDSDDWCKWALKARVRPEIVAFLRFKPDLLHAADTTSDANAWPTPRSWEMASHVLSGIARRQKTQLLSGTSEFEAQLLDGTVGPAAASEVVAFLRLFRQLPSIDEILLNPATAPVPAEPSAQIAIATALGRVLSDNSVGRGVTYLDRMPTEMRVMAMRDAAARDTAITHTPEFVRFGVEYREVIQ